MNSRLTAGAMVRISFICGTFLALPLPAFVQEGAADAVAESAEEKPSTEKKLEDLPLRLTAVADKKKHRWDPLNNGALVKGSGCFNGAMLLTNGDEEFEVEEVWEDTENATYRMKGTLGGLKVERRIMIDRELGAARYLDVFHNTSDEDQTMIFTYKIWMSFAAEKIYTSRGRELAGKLGSRDFGVAIEAPANAGHPGAMIVLAHERSEQKPAITISKDRESIEVDHSVKVKSGQKIALLNWLAQTDFQGPDALDDAFAPIYRNRKLVAKPVAEEYLELVVNFPAVADDAAGGADYLVAVNQLIDRLQLERDTDIDKMRVENGSVLSGDATGGDLSVASRFGNIDVPRAEVAVLQGGAGRGRDHRVFLRDGTVYAGEVTVEGLGLKGGFEVTLEMPQLDYLLYRVGETDGEFPRDTGSFVKLHTSEVLPISGVEDLELGFVSPWGPLDVPMSEIEWMRYVKDPSPRYRISLTDGSQLTVFLNPVDLKVTAGKLGEVTFGAAEMAAMWGAEVELPKGFDEAEGVAEITEIPKSLAEGACLLSGSNLVAGRLAQKVLNVLTGSTVTTVKTSDVVRMVRSGQGTELSPIFTIELSGGDEITGMLQERILDVKSDELTWRVPVQHFIASRSKGAPEEGDEESVSDTTEPETDDVAAAKRAVAEAKAAKAMAAAHRAATKNSTLRSGRRAVRRPTTRP